jgi:hypothetical protein
MSARHGRSLVRRVHFHLAHSPTIKGVVSIVALAHPLFSWQVRDGLVGWFIRPLTPPPPPDLSNAHYLFIWNGPLLMAQSYVAKCSK